MRLVVGRRTVVVLLGPTANWKVVMVAIIGPTMVELEAFGVRYGGGFFFILPFRVHFSMVHLKLVPTRLAISTSRKQEYHRLPPLSSSLLPMETKPFSSSSA
ncbi:hypothetical protein L6164_007372 [Bauhinia variegata]|uniref:Uncharacterized protein n=1 Tax=Bauhinia variegata TaxID=167791 RepID=A0ACB9PES9_BAUVA|nr:hypothetical protein L6164_007372 [Bauhinia variegata]